MRTPRSLITSTFLVLLFAGAARAQEPAPATTEVVVGIYANQVPTMSLKDNRFQVDFYIWFRWKGEELKPHETFELANGKIDSRQVITKEVIEGQNYAVLRCTATVVKFWDVARFPFDDHVLELYIEDNDSEETLLRYVADEANSTISPDLRVPGWRVVGAKVAVKSNTYHTNYGDTTLPKDAESTYSRFVFAVPIERDGHAAYFKLFFALFVAVLIALLSFFVMPNDPGPRLSFAIGAIFASVGASYVIANSLPATATFTIAERVNVVTVATVFLALAGSVFSVRMFKQSNNLARSMKFDRIWAIAVLVLFVLATQLAVR